MLPKMTLRTLLLSSPILYQSQPEAGGPKTDRSWLRRAAEMKHIPSQPSPKSCVCTHELNSRLNSSCWIVSPPWHTSGLSTKHYIILAWVSHLGGPWIIPADSLLMATLFWRQKNLITQMKTALCHWPQDPQNIPKHILIYERRHDQSSLLCKPRDHKVHEVPQLQEATLDGNSFYIFFYANSVKIKWSLYDILPISS